MFPLAPMSWVFGIENAGAAAAAWVHLEPLEVSRPVGVRPCREDVDPKYWFVCVACSSNSCSNVLVKVLIFILRVVHAASGPLVFVCVPLGSKYLVPFVNAPVMCHSYIVTSTLAPP